MHFRTPLHTLALHGISLYPTGYPRLLLTHPISSDIPHAPLYLPSCQWTHRDVSHISSVLVDLRGMTPHMLMGMSLSCQFSVALVPNTSMEEHHPHILLYLVAYNFHPI